jgi:predicted ATPase
MAQPHLPDLLIEGYRGIRRLELKKLGNVNLLVMRNGVGRSSVLEAVWLYSSQGAIASIPTLTAEQGGRRVRSVVFEPGVHPQIREVPDRVPNPPCRSVDAAGFGYDRFGKLWDRIVLTDFEEELNAAQRVSVLLGDGGMRRAMVRMKGSERPVPLKSLGDGLHRSIGIGLSLASAEGGFLLVAEFENGLHCKAQEALWRFVIRKAREWNVQVFATTHREDCIAAFGKAAAGDLESDGVTTKLVSAASWKRRM